MVLKYLFIFFVLIAAISCDADYDYVAEEDCIDYDYSTCNTVEPVHEFLKINLTIDNDNPKVLLIIYKGRYESSDTLFCDSLDVAYYELLLTLDQYYSVKADYLYDNKIIGAVDGTYLEKKTNIICDSTCWYTKGDKIDVRLKY